MSEKQDLDLDFDDIVGKTTPAETTQTKVETKKEEVKTAPVEQKVVSSYGLAFPVGNGQFKNIDLNTASNEDFLQWVQFVFPESSREPKDFESREVRVRALKNIIRFHQSSLQWLRSQEKPVDPKKRKTN